MSSELISNNNERRSSIATAVSTDTSDSKASPNNTEAPRRSLRQRIPSVKKLLGLETSDSKRSDEKESSMSEKDKSPATVTDESSSRSSSPRSRKSSKKRSGSVDMDMDSTRGSTHSSSRNSLHGSTHSSRSGNTRNSSSDLWSPRSTSSSKGKKKSKKKYDISLQLVNLNDLPEELEEEDLEDSKKKKSTKEPSRPKSPKKKSNKKGISSESMELLDEKSEHSTSDKKKKPKVKKRSKTKDKDSPDSEEQPPTISKREKLIRLQSESSILSSTEYGYEEMDRPEGPQDSPRKVDRRWSGDPTLIMESLKEDGTKKKRMGLIRQLSAKARLTDSQDKEGSNRRMTTRVYSQRRFSSNGSLSIDFDSQVPPSDENDNQYSIDPIVDQSASTRSKSSKSGKKGGKSSKKKPSRRNSGKGASLEEQISEISQSTTDKRPALKNEQKLVRRHSARGSLQSQMDDLLSSPQRERKTYSNQRGRSRSSSVDLTLEEIMSSKSSSSPMKKPSSQKRRSKSWDRLMDSSLISGIRQSFTGETPAVTVLPEPDFPGPAAVVDPILD